MDAHRRLAGQFQSRWQCHGHHVAHAAHVVASHPFPELQLTLVDDGFEVEDGEDVFGGVLRHLVVNAAYYGGVEPFGAKLNHDSLPHGDGIIVFGRYAVGVGAGEVQRQQDIDKKRLFHSSYTTFSKVSSTLSFCVSSSVYSPSL